MSSAAALSNPTTPPVLRRRPRAAGPRSPSGARAGPDPAASRPVRLPPSRPSPSSSDPTAVQRSADVRRHRLLPSQHHRSAPRLLVASANLRHAPSRLQRRRPLGVPAAPPVSAVASPSPPRAGPPPRRPPQTMLRCVAARRLWSHHTGLLPLRRVVSALLLAPPPVAPDPTTPVRPRPPLPPLCLPRAPAIPVRCCLLRRGRRLPGHTPLCPPPSRAVSRDHASL